MMRTLGRAGRWNLIALITAMYVSGAFAVAQTPAPQTEAPKPTPVKGVAVRGCLDGTKLTHVEPPEGSSSIPGTLKVTTIRVIRDQLKPLNGHQVELIGALRGIPSEDTGILISDSDKAKVYLGGGDKNTDSDLKVTRNDPPTIHAHTIRDLAPTCSALRLGITR